jgi:uncharacterized coiled-coil protein SlyX
MQTRGQRIKNLESQNRWQESALARDEKCLTSLQDQIAALKRELAKTQEDLEKATRIIISTPGPFGNAAESFDITTAIKSIVNYLGLDWKVERAVPRTYSLTRKPTTKRKKSCK